MAKSKAIKWRKLGGGSFRMSSGKIIKPNEVFSARLEDVPEAFRDIIVPVDPQDVPKPIEPLSTEAMHLRLAPAEGSSDTFNVLDKNDKPVNEMPLPEADAQQLIASLQE